MGAPGRQIAVLTPIPGIKYKTKEDCLTAYLNGEAFIFNLPGTPIDGTVVNKSYLPYEVVKLQFGSNTFLYEGN